MAKAVPTVEEYIQTLEHPLKPVVEELRRIFLASSEKIMEHIKWNSVTFSYHKPIENKDPKNYTGDFVVFNLNKPTFVLLIFPNGRYIFDSYEILGGKFKDSRKSLEIQSVEEAKLKEKVLQSLVTEWLDWVKG